MLLATAEAPGQTRQVDGRVEVARDGGRTEPVSGVWVTLHRVGSDGGAPIDSMRTGVGGRYRFRFAPTGDAAALYFATALYRNIAYFAGPFGDSSTGGDDALILVFDTTTAARASIAGRHMVISSPSATGARTIVEIYELTVGGARTLVAPEGGATFSAPIPDRARDPRAASGDITGETIVFDPGRIRVTASLSPGTRRLAFSYDLLPDDFPLAVPIADSTPALEVLADDSAATAHGAGIVEADPVQLEGRWFRRFVARDPAVGSVVTVSVSRAAASHRGLLIAAVMVVIGAAMLTALARAGFRRPAGRQ